jgi:hypothetical protein
MELAPKCDLIHGLQQVTGKILMSKNLEGEILMTKTRNGSRIIVRKSATSSLVAARIRSIRRKNTSVDNLGLELELESPEEKI